MKVRNLIVFVLLVCFTLVGCNNFVVDSLPVAEPGSGTILVKLAGTAGTYGRTLLPMAPAGFSRYSMSFSGQQSANNIFSANPYELTGGGKSISLPAGDWTITITAHARIRDIEGLTAQSEFPAARGSAAVTVTEGEINTPVVIYINPIISEGEGVLRYSVLSAATLRVLNVEGEELDPPVSLSLAAGDYGIKELAAGFYILKAESGGRVTASVLHIYSGMTTVAILNDDFRFVQQIPPPGNSHLLLRYQVNEAGTAFMATPFGDWGPTFGVVAPWEASLGGSAVFREIINGHYAVYTGLDRGYVNLGPQIGALLQTLPEFTIETLIYVCFWNILRDNYGRGAPEGTIGRGTAGQFNYGGYFIWTFSDTPIVTQTSGRYMNLKASTQIFDISSGGWGLGGGSNRQRTNQLMSHWNGPVRRGMWNHVVLTRSGNTINLIVDGVLKGTLNTTIPFDGFGNLSYNFLSRPVIYGFPGHRNTYLDRTMYHSLSVYNRAFTVEEIQNNILGNREITERFPQERIPLKCPTVPMSRQGFHSQEDFDRVRAMLIAGKEPWVSAYQLLINNSHTVLTFDVTPPRYIVRGATTSINGVPHGQNFHLAFWGHASAYMRALVYRIGIEPNYREFAYSAVDMLNRFVQTTVFVTGNSNQSLAHGIYGYQFAIAGELLRGFDGWHPDDFRAFQEWMLRVWWSNPDFYEDFYGNRNTGVMDFLVRHHGCWDDHYWANWTLSNTAAMMAIGIVTDRRDIYNWALETVQGNFGRPIHLGPNPSDWDTINPNTRRVVGNSFWFKANNFLHTLPDGTVVAQQQESGRAQAYVTKNIGNMSNIAQLAWSQGDDVWGLGNNLLLKGAQYAAMVNIAGLHDIVPFTRYVRLHGGGGSINPLRNVMTQNAPGTSNRYAWAMAYYHYSRIRGVPDNEIRFLRMANQVTAPEGGPELGNHAGTWDLPGFGTLMFARP